MEFLPVQHSSIYHFMSDIPAAQADLFLKVHLLHVGHISYIDLKIKFYEWYRSRPWCTTVIDICNDLYQHYVCFVVRILPVFIDFIIILLIIIGNIKCCIQLGSELAYCIRTWWCQSKRWSEIYNNSCCSFCYRGSTRVWNISIKWKRR